ncbi:MAG: hypothetical protein VKP62_04195 [Candidatus Sericytochromatia bacterium]|nr:hypothetical protein [Candidatus Sericytochromatia bacterium]
MAAPDFTVTLKPGDPPPFWEGLWHPQGLSEGAVHVSPRSGSAPLPGEGQLPPSPPAAAPDVVHMPPPAAAPDVVHMPPPAAAPDVVHMPPPAATSDVVHMPPPAAAPDVVHMPPPAAAPDLVHMPPPPSTPDSTAASTGAVPPAPPPAAPTPPRSLVLTLVAQGPLRSVPHLPAPLDLARAEALRASARELQAQGQVGQALATLSESLKFHAAEPQTYALLGQALMMARATEDAAHHFLLAYMLAPRELAYGRFLLHAAWALGYVGWAFQVAQALHRIQAQPEWVEVGKVAVAWLKGGRPPQHTALCTSCRVSTLVSAPGPCAQCGRPTLGAPANDAGFAGLRLLQQQGTAGRLFVGVACRHCSQEGVVQVRPGGVACQHCHAPALAAL